MIKIEDGKLRMGKVVFPLPDGFYLTPHTDYACEDGITFSLPESQMQIFLGIEQTDASPKEELLSIADGELCFQQSEVFEIQRTGKTGKAMYYQEEDGDCFYEERFALEDTKKHFVLRVQTVCLAQNAVARLQAVLHQKQVDGFLRTITL